MVGGVGLCALLGGGDRAAYLLTRLKHHAFARNVSFTGVAATPYVNTIPVADQPPYPGDRDLERRIKSIIRWNAMAMVVRANKLSAGIGGHISSYASSATLYEVAFNHFIRGKEGPLPPDQVYIQVIPRRAFTPGRFCWGD